MSLIKAFKEDKKTFEDFTRQIKKNQKVDGAALVIQRFYRRWKERQIKKFAVYAKSVSLGTIIYMTE